MFFANPQTAPVPLPTGTARLPLRPSPGPEPLPEPPPGWGWEWLFLLLACVGAFVLLWRLRRQRRRSVPTPQEIAWAALEQISLRLETEPATIFVETAEILRRYWTATGLVPAASLTTKEVLAILTTQEPPPGVTWETVGVALQQADQMKFAGASVGVTEARPWLDLVRVLVGRVRPPDAPQG